MQTYNTIKKSTTVTKVFMSLLTNKHYVSVSELADFLNVFFATYTITSHKINKMLERKGYQRTKTDEELQRDDLLEIKYVPFAEVEDFVKVEKIIRDNEEIHRLLWKAGIILDIFDINIEDNESKIVDSVSAWAYEYDLVNTEKDEIDYELLEKNVKYLLNELKKVRKDE